MRWRDLRIAQKLYIGFGIVFLATLVVGYVGYSGLRTMRQAAGNSLLVSRLSELSLELRRSEKNFIIRGDEKYLTENRNQMTELRSRIDELRQKLDNDADRASLNEVQNSGGQYEAAFAKWVEVSRRMGVTSQKGMTPELKAIDDDMVAAGRGFQKNCKDLLESEKRKMAGAFSSAMMWSSGVMIAALFMVIMGVMILSRSISRPLQEVSKVADGISLGDIDQEIQHESKDEIGTLAESFRRLIEYMRGLAVAADNIAVNDLTLTVEAKSDRDRLGNAFKKMVTNLTGMVRLLTDNSVQLVSAATQIASTSEELSRNTQQQTGQTAQVSSAVEEMTATIVESAKNAGEAASQAREAANAAGTGTQVVSQTIEGMNRIASVVQESAKTIQELSKSSDQIGEIISVIDDIADQTNLLALNAAIEAARAGEQGRGFAVVADEVRKLAERTTKATKEITDMIKGIQHDTKGAVTSMEQGINEVQHGLELADRAGESLNQIAGYAQKVQDMVQQIATATEQQSAASEQIARSVEGIAHVTKENASGVEQSATAAEELNRQAEGMRNMVAQFKLSGGNTGILEVAKNDHRVYLEKLKPVIKGHIATSSWKTVDSHNCRFGKWYDSSEASAFRNTREFAEIAAPHARVHDLANEAVRALSSGDKDKATKLYEQALTASHDVIAHLERLQRAVTTEVRV